MQPASLNLAFDWQYPDRLLAKTGRGQYISYGSAGPRAGAARPRAAGRNRCFGRSPGQPRRHAAGMWMQPSRRCFPSREQRSPRAVRLLSSDRINTCARASVPKDLLRRTTRDNTWTNLDYSKDSGRDANHHVAQSHRYPPGNGDHHGRGELRRRRLRPPHARATSGPWSRPSSGT